MKRPLALLAFAVTAAFVPAPAANADHLCVTSQGQTIYCTPHVYITRPQYCVTSGGRPVVCV